MCRGKYKLWLLSMMFLLLSIESTAQYNRSPYTSRGIGDVMNTGYANNLGMGGLGIGFGSPFFLNGINPALLTLNNYTTFEVGLDGGTRSLQSASQTQTNGGANLGYLGMSFPIMYNRWTSAIGVQPFSFVDYNIQAASSVDGAELDALFQYSGEGGITNFYWSNGVKIIKNLSLGLRFNYLFGGIQNDVVTSVAGGTPFTTGYFERTNVKDFSYTAGAYYNLNLNDEQRINFGATFDMAANLNATRFGRTERRGGSGQPIPGDTLFANSSGKIFLPARYGIGISYENAYKFSVGLDFSYQDWSEFSTFGRSGIEEGLGESFLVVLGTQFIPDPSSITNYFSRVAYRAGIRFEQTPYLINNVQINDFGINFGWSLPVSRSSSMNFGFMLGQRGTLESNLIRENYFRINFGATINDRWFIRRRFD